MPQYLLGETEKNWEISQNSQWPSQVSNQAFPEHKSKALPPDKPVQWFNESPPVEPND
jgi:hypothetical protein